MKSLAVSLTFAAGANAAINFLSLGDWGGIPFRPYYMPGQKESVTGMDAVATAIGSQFVLAVGDNFYFTGVETDTSSRFKNTFEDVYTPQSLQTNWYVLAGNHDHKGNVSAQIAYSGLSARWKFPSEYYNLSFSDSDGTTLDIIMIDTVDLCSMTTKEEDEPGYFDPLPLRTKADAQTQWDWVENQIKSSTADYLLVAGHYPVYSVCEHGNTQTLVDNLRPLLIEYGGQYVSGHDHCMEYFTEPDANVNYILTGMGVDCCYRATQTAGVPAGVTQFYYSLEQKNGVKAGFGSFEVNAQSMNVKFYDQAGNVLYTGKPIPPRTQEMKSKGKKK